MTFHSCEWPAFVIAGPALSLVCNAELCSALLLTDLSTRPNEVGDRYCSQEDWRGRVRFIRSIRPKELRQILNGRQ